MLSARHKLLCDSKQHIKYIRGASSQSQLQSRNDHLGGRVTVMETQPIPPLKIHHRAAFPSPISNTIWVWFNVWSTYSTWLRLLDHRTAFKRAERSWRSRKPKPLFTCNCVNSLAMWWHTDAHASKCPAASYSLYTLRHIQTFTSGEENKKWIIKHWPVWTWEVR